MRAIVIIHAVGRLLAMVNRAVEYLGDKLLHQSLPRSREAVSTPNRPLLDYLIEADWIS